MLREPGQVASLPQRGDPVPARLEAANRRPFHSLATAECRFPAAVEGPDQPPHLGEPPPLAPPAQPAPIPPLLTAAANRASSQVPVGVGIALALVGPLNLLAAIVVSGREPTATDLASRIGYVASMLWFWPLLGIGLFSFSRRYRNPRSYAWIVLAAWGLTLFASIAHLAAGPIRVPPRHHPDARGVAADVAPPSDPPALEPTLSVPTELSRAPAAPAPLHLSFDFSPGSDVRLVKLIESAQEDRYRKIVHEYALLCAARPDDAGLALERVKFIERFAYAEDVTFKTAEDDLKVATDYLHTRFPSAPGTILHVLGGTYGDDFELKVQSYLKQTDDWPAPDRARLYLLSAERTNDPSLKKRRAQGSFAVDPTIAAGALLLSAYQEEGNYAAGLELLEHPVFASPEPYIKVQMLGFLFAAGAHTKAMALYRELKADFPAFVNNAKTANQLAEAGQIEAARAVFAQLPVGGWNREAVLRQRFHFELEYGNSAQAGVTYRAWRDEGFNVDPLLRERFALFRQHPRLAWQARDLLGALMVTLIAGALLALPALLLVPVHYWSLLREKRRKPSAWPAAHWGLREAWVVAGTLLVGSFLLLWLLQPALLRTWWDAKGVDAETLKASDHVVLLEQALDWTAMTVVLALALWRGRGWSVLGRGHWSWRQVLGAAVVGTVALRVLILVYLLFRPELIATAPAALQPMMEQINVALLNQLGPAGLLLTVAGLVPLLEETLFRGVLLQALAKHVPFWFANLAQALLFASVHENAQLLPFLVAFGLTCGWLARRSGGLLASIGVHVGNNAIVCLALIAKHHA